MFGRTRTVAGTTVVSRARGGISATAIITGVVVAFGAMFILSAIAGGILTASGITPDDVSESGAIEAGVGAGIVVVIAQFLAYLWGGYTAGRMARGAGVGNGLLVPLIAIVIAVAVGAVVASLGATANLNLPYSTNRLPLEDEYLIDWGVGIAIAALAAMFLGGALGGAFGSRWHTRLEENREVDLAEERGDAVIATTPRDDDGMSTSTTPVPAGTTTKNPTTRT